MFTTIASHNRHGSMDEGYLELREAIFRQAIEDWEHARKQAREYVLERYAKLDPAEREESLAIAIDLNLYWRGAAETYDFFNTPCKIGGIEYPSCADAYLVDLPFSGADIWEMLLSGSWNRGGILDKPLKKDDIWTFVNKRALESYNKGSQQTNDRLFPKQVAKRRKKEEEKRLGSHKKDTGSIDAGNE